jgi:hypothetical protein
MVACAVFALCLRRAAGDTVYVISEYNTLTYYNLR